MMDYKEKYDAALERARKELQEVKNKDCDDTTRRTVINIVCNLFPELHEESEDERIRRGIIRNLQFLMDRSEGFVKEDLAERIAWLEKQCKRDARYKYLEELLEADTEYQMAMNDAMVEDAKTKAIDAISNMCIFELLGFEKQDKQPTDKVEPKFKVGDFIMNNDITEHGKPEIFKIIKVCSSWYDVENIYDGRQTMITFSQDYTCHLWTIDDANDGDVLAVEPIDGYPSPFVAIYKDHGLDFFNSYCFISFDGKFYEAEEGHSTEEIHPATKEQCDLLFEKIKDAGYEWDMNNKELTIVEQNPAWSKEDEEMLKWLCRIIHSQRVGKVITLKEESELGEWIDKWLNPQIKQSEHLENYDEDEKIRKVLLNDFKNTCSEYYCDGVTRDMVIAWLEKQGEPNPYSGTSFKYNGNTYGMCIRDGGLDILYNNTLIHHIDFTSQDKSDKKDKVEPKFHKGDWVILTAGELSTTLQIVNVDTNKKLYWFNDSSYLPIVDEECLHLWTINDAKDGDVLSFYLEYKGNKMVQTGIIEKYVGKHGGCSNTFKVYVGVDWENNFQIGEYMGCSDIRPATKEQQDMLFEKIKNACYEWDAEKKKLKKIEL